MTKRNIQRRIILIMLLIASAFAFTSCSDSAFEIAELPIEYEDVEKLIIETPGRNVRITTHVEVKTGANASIEGWIHSWKMSGSTLLIKLGGDLVLVMPEENKVEDIEIAIASGSITVEGFDNLEELEGASAEGDISFLSIGRVEDMRADSTNGNLELEAEFAEDVKANSISGDIEFRGNGRDLEFSGLSGNVLVVTDTPAEVRFDTLTGRGNFAHRNGSEMEIEVSTLSGNLTTRKTR